MTGQTTYDFSGESAIVTGSTKGIGRGIAETLVKYGANVCVNSRTPEDVESTIDELNDLGDGTVIGEAADVGEPEGIDRIVESAIETFEEVDLLVNNAAIWPREQSLIDADLEDWNQTMNVNVRAQYYASKRIAEHMIDNEIQGSIINVSSQTGDRRTGGRGLYGISNTAVNGLTWRMAHDCAEHGIRVNAVSTDLTHSYQLEYELEQKLEHEPDRSAEEVLDEWAAERPLGRLGKPDDLAHAVCWLASDKASYVVGTILRVSGGGNLQ